MGGRVLELQLSSPADATPTITLMNVAVIDVGSYTVRLLVCRRHRGALEPVHEARAALALGAEIEREGAISAPKLAETTRQVRSYARAARKIGVGALEVIVTAPGRQGANADELVTSLRRATRAPVRVLSPDQEGQFAFAGAVAGSPVGAESVAVCDVGGGSTEIVVGTRSEGPAWVRSFDIGALRLTNRMLDEDPPRSARLEAAKEEVSASLAGFTPPLPQTALATGGTARALRKLVGSTLRPEDFDAALAIVTKLPSSDVAKTFGIDRSRARTLPAGILILRAVQERLGVPIGVARTGLREGAALALLEEKAAA
jgi:exopolyphosphatase/guanosine-5'-triphosphate,3'-diphosphate pyrophosphatase